MRCESSNNRPNENETIKMLHDIYLVKIYTWTAWNTKKIKTGAFTWDRVYLYGARFFLVSLDTFTLVWTYLNMFCSNDDTFGNRIPIWRSPSGTTDDIHRLLIANLLDRSHIDRVWGHCMLHSLNNILSMFHDRCNICTGGMDRTRRGWHRISRNTNSLIYFSKIVVQRIGVVKSCIVCMGTSDSSGA